MHGEPKPNARSGLLTADHSKRGRRLVTILDPEENRVTILEPWEHAILVLCDGTRPPDEIAILLDDGVQGEPVTLDGVRRCLKFFERQALIEPMGLRAQDAEPLAGPRTLANLQLAYREWHKDPVKTGQILAGDPDPFIRVHGITPIGLSPTVALPDEDNGGRPVAVGTTLVLGASKSAFEGGDRPLRSVFETSGDARTEIGALDDPEPEPPVASVRSGGSAAADPVEEELEELELGDVVELLAAVDSDFDELDEAASQPAMATRPAPGRAMGGVAELPVSRDPLPAASARLIMNESTQRLTRPDEALSPTMVGYAPEGEGEGPVIISPARSPSVTREFERIGAVIGPTPSLQHRNITQETTAPSASGITSGAVVEDTQRFDLPTEGGFVPSHPLEVDSRLQPRHASVPRAQGPAPTPGARDEAQRRVFERLWALGVEARGPKEPARRASEQAKHFERGLQRWTAGDLELVLGHMQSLLRWVPRSTRLRAFSDAVQGLLDGGTGAAPEARYMLDHLALAVEDTMVAGRCPRCLAHTDEGSDCCEACGFTIQRSDAAYTAG